MKIADISDLHLSGKNLEIVQPALEEALGRMKKEGVSLLFIDGDIFDHYNISSRYHSVATVWHAFVDTIRRSGIRTIVIPGQHDQGGPGEKHALVSCEGFVDVVDKIETRVYNDVQKGKKAIATGNDSLLVLFIPWQYPYQYLTPAEMECATAKEIKDLFRKKVEARLLECKKEIDEFKQIFPKGKVKICGHLQIIAAEIGENYLNTEGEFPFHHWFLEDLGADYIALGDFHRRQRIGKCQYVGHFIQNGHGDEGNPNGFMITDTLKGTEVFIGVKSPQYFSFNNKEYERQYLRIESEGLTNFYRIRDTELPELPLLPNVTFKRLLTASEEKEMNFESPLKEETLQGMFERWAAQTQTQWDKDVIDKFMMLDVCQEAQDMRSGSFQELTFIHIKHFGRYEDVRVDFRGKNYVSVFGDNGVGKTILMESIIGVLYGFFPTYDGPYYNRVTRGFHGEAEISIGFVSHNQEWVAQRKVIRNLRAYGYNDKQWTCLYRVQNGNMVACPETITKGKSKEFEQVIRDLVGDVESLLGSVFNSQKRKGDIGEQDDKPRELFFQNLFNVNRFDSVIPRLEMERKKNDEILLECQKATEILEKQRGNEELLQEDIDFTANELKEIETRFEEADLSVQDIRKTLFELEEKARESNNKYSTLSKNNKKIAQNKDEVERLKAIIVEHSKERKNLTEYNGQIEKLLAEMGRKSELSRELREENEKLTMRRVLESEIFALKLEAQKIEDSDCKGERDCIFLREAKRAAETVKEKEKRVKAFSEVEKRIASLKNSIQEIEQKEGILNKVRVDMARAEERLKQIPVLVNSIKQKKKESAELKAENDAMVIMPHKEINAQKKETEVQLGEAERAKRRVGEERREKTKELAIKQEQYNNFNRVQDELIAIGKTYTEAERYKKNLDVLHQAFGQKGIPRLLMQESIPQVQQIIDSIMNGIESDFLIKIRNSNQNLKTMTEKDGIFIKLEDFNGEANVKEFSPGMQDFAKTIIRLAVAIYNTQRMGGSYNVFIGDEMFTSLTEENTLKMIGIIKNATKFFNQVILIDHHNMVIDQFPFKIELKMEGRNVKVIES